MQHENRRNIINLGWVSFFNDLSSEVVTRALPLYLLTIVKSSVQSLGWLEALTEATAIILKLLSGSWSDRIKKRKPFLFAGYALSILSRGIVVISPSYAPVLLARLSEKVGKGIRTAPRDALIVDLSTEQNRGKHFGINRAMDTAGAVVGLSLVILFLNYYEGGETQALQYIMWGAAVLGVIALGFLGWGVKDVPPKHEVKATHLRLRWSDLPTKLKKYLVIVFFFSMASSSDAFLIMRMKDMSMALKEIFIVIVGFNLVGAISAYYLSKNSDQHGRKSFLIFGWLLYAGLYLLFSLPGLTPVTFGVLMCVYGLYYGFTEGVEKALVADLLNPEQKGFSYGWFAVVNGIGIIPANVGFALLYEKVGHEWAYLFSAGSALIGVAMISVFKIPKMQKV